jgi:hypothetical protein
MSRFLITTLIMLFLPAQDNFTLTEFVRDYDRGKDVTTLRMIPQSLSGPKGQYHSLTFSVSYSYPGQTPTPAKEVDLELVSVVKARTLNSDLYVVFVVDGEETHFGSNRSAIRNPVRGKPWVGERMVFRIPREDFIKLASAKKLSVKLGGVSFDFTDSHLFAMRSIIDPASTPSIPPQTSPHRL